MNLLHIVILILLDRIRCTMRQVHATTHQWRERGESRNGVEWTRARGGARRFVRVQRRPHVCCGVVGVRRRISPSFDSSEIRGPLPHGRNYFVDPVHRVIGGPNDPPLNKKPMIVRSTDDTVHRVRERIPAVASARLGLHRWWTSRSGPSTWRN